MHITKHQRDTAHIVGVLMYASRLSPEEAGRLLLRCGGSLDKALAVIDCYKDALLRP